MFASMYPAYFKDRSEASPSCAQQPPGGLYGGSSPPLFHTGYARAHLSEHGWVPRAESGLNVSQVATLALTAQIRQQIGDVGLVWAGPGSGS